MHSLGDLLPEPEVLLRLEPEEIGGLLLQYLTAALDPAGNFYRGRFEMDLYGSDSSYSHAKRSEVTEALHEAVAWLEGQALIIWPNGYSGGTEYRKLSRKGRSLGSPAA